MMWPVGEDAPLIWMFRDNWWEFSDEQQQALRNWWKNVALECLKKEKMKI